MSEEPAAGGQSVLDGLGDGLRLVLHGNDVLLDTTLRTLELALFATLVGALVGVPAGAALGLSRARGAATLRTLAAALVRVPPVVSGLVVVLLLTEASPDGGGPLAALGWSNGTQAAYLGQTLLAVPLMTALTAGAVAGVDPGLLLQARALGASAWGRAALAVREARRAVLAGVLVTLGVAITAIGAIAVAHAPTTTEARGAPQPATLAVGALQAITQSGADVADRTAATDRDLTRKTPALAVAYATVLLGLFALLAAGLTALQADRTRWTPRPSS